MTTYVKTIAGDFDQARRDRFKAAYDAAVAQGLETFVIENHVFVTSFVKYLLEHLANEGLK